MKTLDYNGRQYQVDDNGFLADHHQWDENFAEGMAAFLGMTTLSARHWKVINYIRDYFKKTGKCPLVYETCRENGLFISELKELFPTGYLRGACRVAGITYREGFQKLSWSEPTSREIVPQLEEKVYRVDVRGFLVKPSEWDANFAAYHAHESRIEGNLTDMHWKIINHLRDAFRKTRAIPTVYETCEAFNITILDLEKLFPEGYHRGAVKLAGLRVR